MIIQNRFGRIVSVSNEEGLSMIRKKEATLFEPDTTPKENSSTEESISLECPYCDKVCKNQLGYKKHTEACKKKVPSSQS